jgi:hypothetical protein
MPHRTEARAAMILPLLDHLSRLLRSSNHTAYWWRFLLPSAFSIYQIQYHRRVLPSDDLFSYNRGSDQSSSLLLFVEDFPSWLHPGR